MSLQTDISSDISETARRMAAADEIAQRRIESIFGRVARDMLKLEKDIVHVKTGRLRAGLEVQGPINIARGELVATLSAPSVPYADEEAGRNGTHDFARRTIYEGQNIIDRGAQEMGDAIITALQGGR